MSVVDDDAKIPPLPSNSVLTELRDSAVQCRELLHELSSSDNDAGAAYEGEEMMAAFNILAANMGIFRQGQYSLASRLHNVPEIATIIRQLFDALQHHLVIALAEGDSGQEGSHHAASCSSESDDSSDRSSVYSDHVNIPKAVQEEKKLHIGRGSSAAVASARGIIQSLRQLSLTLRLAGAQHRSQRIQRFRTHNAYSQVFELFSQLALQKANHVFPLAPAYLTKRIVESIASRRIRFLYLERHQMKISTMNQPAPALSPTQQQQGSAEKSAEGYVGQSKPRGDSLLQPSIILSSTEYTNFEPKNMGAAVRPKAEQAESVSSTFVSHIEFPKPPILDAGGASFTCPYCLLVCPVQETRRNQHDTMEEHRITSAEKDQGSQSLDENLWRNHLIRDFEPFFCVLEDCASPFECADSYSGWLSHLKNKHFPPTWRCWHCGIEGTVSFDSPGELDDHLQQHHGHEVSDTHRASVVKHSVVRKKGGLESCPFCGGFPEDIEKRLPDRQSSQAQEELFAHIREHLTKIALILAPVRAEGTNDEGNGRDADSVVSTSRRDNSNYRGDFDFGRDSDERDMVHLVCSRLECDCKTPSRIPPHDVPDPAEKISGWSLEDPRPIAEINKVWLEVKEQKQEAQPNKLDWLEEPVIQNFSRSLQQSASESAIKEQVETKNQKQEAQPNEPNWQLGRTRYQTITSLSQRVADEMFYNHHSQEFLPDDKFHSFVNEESVVQILTAANLGNDKSLVRFVMSDAARLFLTLVSMSSKDAERVSLLKTLKYHVLTNGSLPVTFQVMHDASGRKTIWKRNDDPYLGNAGPGPQDPFHIPGWGRYEITLFNAYQWKFIAPVFGEGQPFRFRFQHDIVLPYVTVNGSRGSNGFFREVTRVHVHAAHIKGPKMLKNKDGSIAIALKKANDDPEFHKHFDKEAENLEKLRNYKSNHLIKPIAAYQHGEDRCLLFPWAAGGNLTEYWSRNSGNSLARNELAWIFSQLTGLFGALEELHATNCRHGALKPENIMLFIDVDNKKTLQIADLGFTTFRHLETGTEIRRSYEIVNKTPPQFSRYEPPETGKDWDKNPSAPTTISRACDMWSMGCVVLELLIWLAYGFDTVKKFRADTAYLWERFRVKGRGETYTYMYRVQSDARRHIKDLSTRWQAQSAWRELLMLVENRLLVVNVSEDWQVSSPSQRETARVAHREMRRIQMKYYPV